MKLLNLNTLFLFLFFSLSAGEHSCYYFWWSRLPFTTPLFLKLLLCVLSSSVLFFWYMGPFWCKSPSLIQFSIASNLQVSAFGGILYFDNHVFHLKKDLKGKTCNPPESLLSFAIFQMAESFHRPKSTSDSCFSFARGRGGNKNICPAGWRLWDPVPIHWQIISSLRMTVLSISYFYPALPSGILEFS